ncbi:hypothetical protein L207DRAFT_590119 [Hyaloscypha variabilis F]|uniref:Lysine-specific metallo-endopeptidase domain-containing protein n=1 Tax=Hyaloscypha variabilis (strain UAMH 11265 / GT02V1 / F) TaxID=1149755 RepID=A0A2J6R3G0_HYAVF|nr:hypothetical protein L207DRAFT_590119 [Hyaloscypha variabilis F]
MQINLFKALLLLITFGQCHVANQPTISWTLVGCDDWTYPKKDPAKPNLELFTIQQIWDNANLMITNAMSQIDAIPIDESVLLKTFSKKSAGINAEFMFGTHWTTFMGATKGDAATFTKIKETYTDIQSALAKTLITTDTTQTPPTTILDLPNTQAFLFCEGDSFQYGKIKNTQFEFQNVWYAEVTSTATDGTAGRTEYLVPSAYASGGSVRPCTEPFIKDQDPNDPRQPYIGKTFDTVQKIIKTGENEGTAVEETFLGMILCPSQHPGFPTPNAILKQNFQPPKPPVSDFSTSVAGTLLHEMAHVVGRSKKINGRWADQASGFNQCVSLAKSKPDQALINPDSYRIFAEMNMSPATEWRARKSKDTAPTGPSGSAGPSGPGPKKPGGSSRRARRYVN